MHVEAVQYKDVPALMLENETLRVVVLPGIGGKTASLVDKKSGFEFLTQREGASYRRQPYSGDYLKGECSGFDDMFPTIDACRYLKYPWAGAELPDHGEVWALPWTAVRRVDGLELSVAGVRLPYTLKKTLSFPDDRTIRYAYEAANPTPFVMDCLWAAHMMFAAEPGAKVTLPPGADRAVCTFSKNGEVGGYGDEFPWPEAVTAAGDVVRLDALRGPEHDNILKYYLKEPLRDGWCALEYPSRNLALGLAFPVEVTPYLALLHNEGGSHDLWDGADYYNFFFEPCTAPMDRPDVAELFGRGWALPAGATIQWHLDVVIAAPEKVMARLK